ncbi:MAG: PAS domain-containing protein, partial [Myxococcales bacterium]|nr:PAS domain-containing protein [Myxococcales bacterium]
MFSPDCLLFAQAPVATIRWDDAGRVTAWNAAAERLFGHGEGDVLGEDIAFFLPAASGDAEALWREIAAAGAAGRKVVNATRDGRALTCQWHFAPLVDAAGAQAGAFTVVLDLTDQERLRGALARTQRMDAVSRIAGGVAHEYNNLLGVVLSYADFLRDSFAPGDPRRAEVAEITDAARRATELTTQLLSVAHKRLTARGPTDLRERVAFHGRLLERTLGERVALAVRLPDEPVVVDLDPAKLDQLLLNLVLNARDAMPDGGQITVSVEVAEGRARLVVADDGEGMAEDVRKRVFEPFFTTRTDGAETGLGLSTSYAIVVDAGGAIDVVSTPGAGATFTATLPLSASLLPAAEHLDEVTRVGFGERVLLVEDQAELRRATARVLERGGFNVVIARDGGEAIQKIDALGPAIDLVVTDVRMPCASGFDVERHAARVIPGRPVVLTSGYPERRGSERRADILWKPVRPRELLRAVAARLADAQAAPPTELVVLRASADPTGDEPACVLIVEDDDAMR